MVPPKERLGLVLGIACPCVACSMCEKKRIRMMLHPHMHLGLVVHCKRFDEPSRLAFAASTLVGEMEALLTVIG